MTDEAIDLSEEPAGGAGNPEEPAVGPAIPGRLMSVDALRGFDMFWIIGGHGFALALAGVLYDQIPPGVYYHLSHPKWTGFSAWDLIMPLFLFIVGVAMPFSFARRIEQGHSTGQLYRKIVVRTLILFVFGMVAQGHLLEFDLSKLHIFCNTLQAIAVGYLVSGILLLRTGTRAQIGVTAGLLLVFWAVLMLIPSPDKDGVFRAGLLEPEYNVALHVDRMVFGSFEDGTTYTWLLSSLGFVASVMLGVFGGKVLRAALPALAKAAWLLVLGFGCLGAGWLWSHWLPIIKHIWTSSMVLWAGGFCYLLLAVFYLLIDVLRFRIWAFPFVVIGMNAIFVYMATHVFSFSAISNPLVGGIARNLAESEMFGKPWAELLQRTAQLAVIWVILWFLYRKRTFLRI